MARRILLALLVLATIAAGKPGAARAGVPCRDGVDGARPLTLRVEGERATGLYAVPDRRPTGLVVFAHGYGHTSESWREHLVRTARDHGVVAVAMDYRGTEIVASDEPGGLPSSRGWQVAEGAEDSIAAAALFERRCPSIRDIVMYGVSMGGNSSGLAVAAGATRTGGQPLFDWWIDIEGATNVIETYQEARLVAQSGNAYASNAVADIERQMGGTFEEAPEVYAERTVVNRVDDIAASGVRGVIVVHGVDDGLVPYNQSRELVTRLRQSRVPTELYTVLTRGPESESGTTLTGTFLAGTPYDPPFAGHASETSTTHTVGAAGFTLLAEVLSGREVGCGEFVIDGRTDTREGSAGPC